MSDTPPLKPGWLKRQCDIAAAATDKWPAWMLEEAGLKPLEEKMNDAKPERPDLDAIEVNWSLPLTENTGAAWGGVGVFRSAAGVILPLLKWARHLEQENHDLREMVADAAMEINCAGPLSHRIRVLKDHYSGIIAGLEKERDSLRLRADITWPALRQLEIDLANVTYERETLKERVAVLERNLKGDEPL